jgi:hypothetical protein
VFLDQLTSRWPSLKRNVTVESRIMSSRRTTRLTETAILARVKWVKPEGFREATLEADFEIPPSVDPI